MTIPLTKNNCREVFDDLVKETRKRLPNGCSRFPDFTGKVPLALSCLIFYTTIPNFESPRKPEKYEIELSNEFWEDINTITSVINDFDIKFDICEWLKDERSKKHCNEQGMAIQIWEQYANPFRHHGEYIYLIFPPDDYLFGVPEIRELTIDDFLVISTHAFERYACEVKRIAKQKDRFDKLFAISAIINIFMISIAIYSIIGW